MKTRIYSHFQAPEPILENFIRYLRYRTIKKYVQKDSKVLDLGCGYEGWFLLKISPIIKQGVGYDLSVSNKKTPNNIKLKKGKVDKKVQELKNSYDLVIALAVLEHTFSPEGLVAEAFHTLKPGGKLIITTPSESAKPILEILAFKLGLLSKKEIKDHKQYFNKISLRKLLCGAGFKSRSIDVKTFMFGLNLLAIATK